MVYDGCVGGAGNVGTVLDGNDGGERVAVGKSYVCGLGMPRQAGANALWHLVDKWLESIG